MLIPGRSLCFDQPMPGARRHLKKKGYIFLAALYVLIQSPPSPLLLFPLLTIAI